jgi:hypothetical protein
MNSSFDYCYLRKDELSLAELVAASGQWDRLISGFNLSDRVTKIFSAATTPAKHWLIFPEYHFAAGDLPNQGVTFTDATVREDEYVHRYFSAHKLQPSERLCIDITGFMRPQLMFLLAYLHVHDVKRFDLLYSEPDVYAKADKTQFSGEVVQEVRQVKGFEGAHSTETENDLLIVGCGYDHRLISFVNSSKAKARKVPLFSFPSLRPHMYQESRVRTAQAEESFGANCESSFFAPAYDPFATANILREIVTTRSNKDGNVYLSPLATKPQVVGFALYYICELRNKPASIIFPFSGQYSQRTSDGVSSIWQYTIEFP